MSDENFIPDAVPRQLCQWEYSYGGVLPRGLRQVTTPAHITDQRWVFITSTSCLITTFSLFSLFQFVRPGEDDDGQVSSRRDPGEGRSLRGRGQDGRRSFHLLLVQVSRKCITPVYSYRKHCNIDLEMQSNIGTTAFAENTFSISHLEETFHIVQGSSGFRKTLKVRKRSFTCLLQELS